MSGKTKILAIMLLGLGMIFMLLAFLSGQSVKKGSDALKTELERIPVVVTTKSIKFGEPISSDMIKVEKFAIAPPGSYKDPAELIGKKPLYSVGQGLPITEAFFEPGAVASEVRTGFRAFALRLDENNIATAKIKAGDFVDVFSIFKAQANSKDLTDTVSRLVLPRLRVLSVGNQLVNAPESAKAEEKDTNNQKVRQRAITVEVPLTDVNTLAIAQNEAELFVVIRGQEDEEVPDLAKFIAPDPVLKPKDPKLDPANKGKKDIPEVVLNDSEKAYAGSSFKNTALPGSANKKIVAPPATGVRPESENSNTVEVIRGGELSKEKAR